MKKTTEIIRGEKYHSHPIDDAIGIKDIIKNVVR